MKRSSESPPCPVTKSRCKDANSASLICLNVGGHFYDTTPQTLAGAVFFQPLLTGRLHYAVDTNGRIFIDRSGALFEHVLQFLRTCTRPSQTVIDTYGKELLIECDFYGIDWLMQHLR
eukprot:11295759-Karenia_brevis.AAC.1